MEKEKERVIYLRYEKPENDDPFLITYDSEAAAVESSDHGDVIFRARLETVGTVKKSVEVVPNCKSLRKPSRVPR